MYIRVENLGFQIKTQGSCFKICYLYHTWWDLTKGSIFMQFPDLQLETRTMLGYLPIIIMEKKNMILHETLNFDG